MAQSNNKFTDAMEKPEVAREEISRRGRVQTPGAEHEVRPATAVQVATDAQDSILQLRVDEIVPHPYNPQHRYTTTAKLGELIADIAHNGVLQPVVVASRDAVVNLDPSIKERIPNRACWVLLAGHRRWAASREAGRIDLPAMTRDDLADPVGVIETFLRENLGRQEIMVLEEAERYAWLKEREPKLSQRTLARRIGVTQGQVSKRLKLLELPESAKRALNDGTISLNEAERILTLPPEDRRAALRTVQESGLDVDTAVARRRAHEDQTSHQSPQRVVTEGEAQCAVAAESHRPDHIDQRRREACGRLLADYSRLKTSVILEILAEAVLILPMEQAALRHGDLIEDWLGERVGGPRDLTDLLGDRRRTRRMALAAILAVLEEEAAEQYYVAGHPWPPEVARHVRRLVKLGYHELSVSELAKLG